MRAATDPSPPSTNPRPASLHQSVMAEAAVSMLLTRSTGVYVDGTTGLGGHTRLIATKLIPPGHVLAIDRDAESLAIAQNNLTDLGNRVSFLRENFRNLPLVLNRLGLASIDGLLLDLGVSSFQLGHPERGFSFQTDGPLDMRMDLNQKTTAADLVNSLPEAELADILYQFGEERRSRVIARKIVAARRVRRIVTTLELAALVEQVLGPKGRRPIHPATRTFQALRIAVNQELEGLGDFLIRMVDYLNTGARVAIITFHSLEDRIVKRAFNVLEGRCICHQRPDLCSCPRVVRARAITRKPILPEPDEIKQNPRARSAKLRVVEVIAAKPEVGRPVIEESNALSERGSQDAETNP